MPSLELEGIAAVAASMGILTSGGVGVFSPVILSYRLPFFWRHTVFSSAMMFINVTETQGVEIKF